MTAVAYDVTAPDVEDSALAPFDTLVPLEGDGLFAFRLVHGAGRSISVTSFVEALDMRTSAGSRLLTIDVVQVDRSLVATGLNETTIVVRVAVRRASLPSVATDVLTIEVGEELEDDRGNHPLAAYTLMLNLS